MITWTSLVQPTGEVAPEMFPEDFPDGEDNGDFQARLTGYLSQGYSRADVAAISDEARRDLAASYWAYHRAFNAAYLRMVYSPSHASLDAQGSSQFSNDQISRMRSLSERNLELFREAVTRSEPDTSAPAPQGTTAVPTQFTF